MAKTGEIDVAGVARLARLDLTEDETRLFQKQLDRVLEYVEKLKQVHSDASSGDKEIPANALRRDEPHDWLTAEEALRNAPRQANDLFVVPKVVE
ncbi:MAG TPA: Asp-tRNA(Asn)/Glu-tRNA(Gln) amidotransferase subunit GatC [Chthoniobacterales bacterium]|nr:Asp-tRNA(Asn)/Glu-tRNA(Gln) amidotransferase subunit GatC [Chthoniobacterales bacterium]